MNNKTPAEISTTVALEDWKVCSARYNCNPSVGYAIALLSAEERLRKYIKESPAHEPLGNDVLSKVADSLRKAHAQVWANRVERQDFRSPSFIPFRDLRHINEYLALHLGADVACDICPA